MALLNLRRLKILGQKWRLVTRFLPNKCNNDKIWNQTSNISIVIEYHKNSSYCRNVLLENQTSSLSITIDPTAIKFKIKNVQLGNQHSNPSISRHNFENVQMQKRLTRKSNQQPSISNQTTITKMYKCTNDEFGHHTRGSIGILCSSQKNTNIRNRVFLNLFRISNCRIYLTNCTILYFVRAKTSLVTKRNKKRRF